MPLHDLYGSKLDAGALIKNEYAIRIPSKAKRLN